MPSKQTKRAKKKRASAKPGRRAGGRPSAYKPEFVQQAKKLCELGAIDVELADFFGVSIRTIADWKTRHSGFLQALKAGKDSADDRVERSLYLRAAGYTFDSEKIFLPKDSRTPVRVKTREHCPPDVVACIFWLKNRRREIWRDRQEHEHGGIGGGAIKTEDVTPRSELEIARQIAFALQIGMRASGKKEKP
jgi:hypothetical protein